ncbi:MAG: 30S ribosomal protein S13 [bacterium]|nr:30S ribosomal protein S13 [bacterium]
MPRLIGINIPDNKRIERALTYIYGIGISRSREILKATGVDINKRAKDLTPDELKKLKDFIEKSFKTEGELRRELMMNIKQLKEIGCWRGLRHAKGLTVRGQRTKRNSRTVRGNVRKTVGSGRVKAPAPK